MPKLIEKALDNPIALKVMEQRVLQLVHNISFINKELTNN